METPLQEIFLQIEDNMNNGKWLDAHRLCLEILRFDPENLKAIRIKNKVEKMVKKYNRKAIKDDLAKLKPLWKEQKYEELVTHLKKLEAYIADYPPLKGIFEKAANAYRNQLKHQQGDFYKTQFAAIENLVKAGKYQDAMREAEKLRLLKFHEKDIKNLIKTLRATWIDHEIQSNMGLLKTEKYEEILMFYQYLQKIDPASLRLKRLIDQTKKVYQGFKIEEKREFLYASLEKIRTLYQLKKFEKTVEALQEVLAIDPWNKEAKSLFQKSSRRVRKMIAQETILQILNAQKQQKVDYQHDKKSFRRF